jgi:hypothetical protein
MENRACRSTNIMFNAPDKHPNIQHRQNTSPNQSYSNQPYTMTKKTMDPMHSRNFSERFSRDEKGVIFVKGLFPEEWKKDKNGHVEKQPITKVNYERRELALLFFGAWHVEKIEWVWVQKTRFIVIQMKDVNLANELIAKGKLEKSVNGVHYNLTIGRDTRGKAKEEATEVINNPDSHTNSAVAATEAINNPDSHTNSAVAATEANHPSSITNSAVAATEANHPSSITKANAATTIQFRRDHEEQRPTSANRCVSAKLRITLSNAGFMYGGLLSGTGDPIADFGDGFDFNSEENDVSNESFGDGFDFNFEGNDVSNESGES